MKKINHDFSAYVFYLFSWGNKEAHKISSTFSTWVNKNEDGILFQVDDGRGKFDSLVTVIKKKADIIAFKDDVNGGMKIKGFAGKYTILNKELLEMYITQGLVELVN